MKSTISDNSIKKNPDMHKEIMFALGVPSELIPEETTEALARILTLPEEK